MGSAATNLRCAAGPMLAGIAMLSKTFQMYLLIMLGGALGTGLRLWVSTLMVARYGERFPFGTLAVNVIGSFVIGLFVGLTGPGGSVAAPLPVRQFAVVGVLGGFTTFSAFSLQTYELASQGAWTRAGLNVLLSVCSCLLAVWLGMILARALNPKM